MSIYMRSYNYEMYDVIMNGPYVPMKTKKEREKIEQKQKSEWTNVEMKKVQINFKIIITLHYVLKPMEFNRILTCKSTKEIWEKSTIEFQYVNRQYKKKKTCTNHLL